MIQPFELRVTCPRGDLLVGGYSAVPAGVDAVHARDAAGRPLIPSTALRGALREALEAVLRGAGEPVCAGGDGAEPGGETPSPPAGCALDGGAPCKACRLFGTQQRVWRDGPGPRGALMLEDAVMEGPDAPWRSRHGVAVARAARSAQEKLLVDRLVPPLRGRTFTARGMVVGPPELRPLLEAAARATTHVGSGRSRGFARVDLAVQWLETTPEPAAAAGAESADRVRIRVTLRSPAFLGELRSSEWFRHTRQEIPGAALRGAVATVLAETLASPSEWEAVAPLVAEAGARFGFLYPVDGDEDEMAAPWPLTARVCKYRPDEHPVVDTLLDRLAAALAETPLAASAVEATSARKCPADGCDAALRACQGSRRSRRGPKTRQITRLALDRRRQGAREPALFTHTVLERGNRFEGVIDHVPAECAGLLARALALPLSVGRGRSMGWGRVDVEVLRAPRMEPVEARRDRFRRALDARLGAAHIAHPSARLDRLLPITLLSPLVADDHDPDGSATLAAALDVPVKGWVVRARRFATEGGWDQRAGRMTPVVATVAGSVFVAELDDGVSIEALLEAASRLEDGGAGGRQAQGFGRLVCFDPLIVRGRSGR